MAIKRSPGERIFQAFTVLFMVFLMFVTLYPLWYVLIASLSRPADVARGVVVFWPSGFELASYKKVTAMPYIWSAYGNTVFYSVGGTTLNMLLTTLGAYALSKRRLVGRRFFTLIILIPMWFGAGMLPTFMNFRNIGLFDNRLSVIMQGAVNTFYVILLRTFFENVPDAMEESAKIDGANDLRILLNIYLPLSIPALATLTMYYFVGRWNTYFWPMVLISDQTKIPLQVLLRRLIVEVTHSVEESQDLSLLVMTEQTIIYATIVVSVIPMMCFYPFIQRFFVKGIMVGAIKG